MILPPTWLEVDLGALRFNLNTIQGAVGPRVQLIGVVKDNAYGHGLELTAPVLEAAGMACFGVATADEALQLRSAGIRQDILVMGAILPDAAEEMVAGDITCAVCDREMGEDLAAAALRQNRGARVELKVDTGMGRLGASIDQVVGVVAELESLPGINVEGVFSHLACADEPDPAFTCAQFDRFMAGQTGINGCERFRWHIASSAAAVRFPQMRLDAIRPGLLLYGVNPVGLDHPLPLAPALSWKARIAFVKQIPPGASVSYGRTFAARRWTTVATLPVGYGDGYPRTLSNAGEVIVGGRRAPVIGRICMDQMLIEVPPGVEARRGDEVILLGKQRAEQITVDEVCQRAGIIPHELLARLGTRAPRIPVNAGSAEITGKGEE